MELIHTLLMDCLQWVFVRVEDRFGTAAAWFVTATLAFAFIAALITVLMVIF